MSGGSRQRPQQKRTATSMCPSPRNEVYVRLLGGAAARTMTYATISRSSPSDENVRNTSFCAARPSSMPGRNEETTATVSVRGEPSQCVAFTGTTWKFTSMVIAQWLATAPDDPAEGWTAAEPRRARSGHHSTFTCLLEPMLSRAGFDIRRRWLSPTRMYAAYTCVRR